MPLIKLLDLNAGFVSFSEWKQSYLLLCTYARAYSLEERMDFTFPIECIHCALHKPLHALWG